MCRHAVKTGEIACFFNFGADEITVPFELGDGSWVTIADTFSQQWGGKGEVAPFEVDANSAEISLGPFNAVVYRKEN